MPKDRGIYIILIGNLIPLFGFFFLQWELSEIYLFYLFELIIYFIVLIPKNILYIIHKRKLYKYKRYGSWVTKSGASVTRYISEPKSITGQVILDTLFIFFYNTTMFAVGVFFFCIHGFDPSYKTAFSVVFDNIFDISVDFFIRNYPVLLYTVFGYLYGFYYYHIYKKEYLRIPYEYQSSESNGRNIMLFYVAVFFPVIINQGIQMYKEIKYYDDDISFDYNDYRHHVLFSIAMFLFKMITDLLVHVKKRKLLEKYGDKTSADNTK